MLILDVYLIGAIASGISVLMDAEDFKKLVSEPPESPLQHRPFASAMGLMWLWPIIIGYVIWKILTGGLPSTRR